ncbi:optic atrophy 3 protein homolog [Sesamum indicum]|uniref:Optic atrophy 3 protein homolog n=1 Tax=Sesamum indicum TaxID=4182 RepID=A0A6I9UYK5_SESIN|nr:optic atrophy 3 protein homolog [Sesamum indicum]
MILPVFKLGTLALKTLCKPIGNRIKKGAGLHPRFRQSIINIAQANHRLTTTLQRRIYGHATDVAIRPLNEEKAVQAAADLLGELFVFTVAGVAVVFEVQRSSRSEARKEELRKQELEVMRQRDEELAREVEQLKHRLAELEQLTKDRGLSSVFSFRHSKATDNKTKDSHSS